MQPVPELLMDNCGLMNADRALSADSLLARSITLLVLCNDYNGQSDATLYSALWRLWNSLIYTYRRQLTSVRIIQEGTLPCSSQ